MDSSKHRKLALTWLDKYRTLAASIRMWIRQEIVDDDPWDVDTLFPSEANNSLLDSTDRLQNPAQDQDR